MHDPDFRFIEIKEGTKRLSFLELIKKLAIKDKTFCPEGVVAILCGIHDIMKITFDCQSDKLI